MDAGRADKAGVTLVAGEKRRSQEHRSGEGILVVKVATNWGQNACYTHVDWNCNTFVFEAYGEK